MARIRTIKPEFFQHDGLGHLSVAHRLLYVGLWCQADREGRLPDRPARIRVAILPYDSLQDADVDAMLWDLAEHGERFIVRYTDSTGKPYIAIPTFSQHQRPHPKDAESKIPDPGDEGVSVRYRDGKLKTGNSVEIPGNYLSSGHASKSPRVQDTKSPIVKESKKGESEGKNRQTWATPYFDAWKQQHGPDADFQPQIGPAGKYLQPLHEKHGKRCVEQFRAYIATMQIQFIDWKKFASGFGTWSSNGVGPHDDPEHEDFSKRDWAVMTCDRGCAHDFKKSYLREHREPSQRPCPDAVKVSA